MADRAALAGDHPEGGVAPGGSGPAGAPVGLAAAARAAHLRSALASTGMTTEDLWLQHLHLGADLLLHQVADALAGRLELRDHEYAVLEQTLVEAAWPPTGGSGTRLDVPRATAPRDGAPGQLRLTGAEHLVCSGDIDVDVVRGFTASDEQLARVRVVDLSAVTAFDRAALTLVVRCLQLARCGVEDRLRLEGAPPRVRADLGLLGVLELVELHEGPELGGSERVL